MDNNHSLDNVSLIGDERLSRSYLAVRHLLRQIEIHREKGISRQVIPDWFSKFVDGISDQFEPFSGVARVGYECAFSDGGWEISVFLGENEIVGGADDGRMLPVNFRFDINGIARQFDQIDTIHWNAFPNSPAKSAHDVDLSFITVTGIVQGENVLLQLQATPPNASVGPAIRQHADGTMELV